MADLSGMNLRKLDPINWDEYPPGGGMRKPPHPPGTYAATAPSLSDIKFDTRDGYLRFVNKATILDPLEGKDEVIFDYVSNKPYARGKRIGASRMGDFLLAVGVEARPQSHEEWAEAVEEGADGTFNFILDWDAYDDEAEKSAADTYDDFPDDPNRPGSKLPYMEVTRADGTTKRVRARQRVRFYVFGRD